MSDRASQVEAYFQACARGDGADIASCFTPDAVIFDTNHAPVRGRAEIGEFWARTARRWGGATWSVDTVVEDGDAAAIEWSMRGVGPAGPFAVRGSEHYRFDGALIAQIRQYWTFDPAQPGSQLEGFPYGEAGCFG